MNPSWGSSARNKRGRHPGNPGNSSSMIQYPLTHLGQAAAKSGNRHDSDMNREGRDKKCKNLSQGVMTMSGVRTAQGALPPSPDVELGMLTHRSFNQGGDTGLGNFNFQKPSTGSRSGSVNMYGMAMNREVSDKTPESLSHGVMTMSGVRSVQGVQPPSPDKSVELGMLQHRSFNQGGGTGLQNFNFQKTLIGSRTGSENMYGMAMNRKDGGPTLSGGVRSIQGVHPQSANESIHSGMMEHGSPNVMGDMAPQNFNYVPPQSANESIELGMSQRHSLNQGGDIGLQNFNYQNTFARSGGMYGFASNSIIDEETPGSLSGRMMSGMRNSPVIQPQLADKSLQLGLLQQGPSDQVGDVGLQNFNYQKTFTSDPDVDLMVNPGHGTYQRNLGVISDASMEIIDHSSNRRVGQQARNTPQGIESDIYLDSRGRVRKSRFESQKNESRSVGSQRESVIGSRAIDQGSNISHTRSRSQELGFNATNSRMTSATDFIGTGNSLQGNDIWSDQQVYDQSRERETIDPIRNELMLARESVQKRQSLLEKHDVPQNSSNTKSLLQVKAGQSIQTNSKNIQENQTQSSTSIQRVINAKDIQSVKAFQDELLKIRTQRDELRHARFNRFFDRDRVEQENAFQEGGESTGEKVQAELLQIRRRQESRQRALKEEQEKAQAAYEKATQSALHNSSKKSYQQKELLQELVTQAADYTDDILNKERKRIYEDALCPKITNYRDAPQKGQTYESEEKRRRKAEYARESQRVTTADIQNLAYNQLAVSKGRFAQTPSNDKSTRRADTGRSREAESIRKSNIKTSHRGTQRDRRDRTPDKNKTTSRGYASVPPPAAYEKSKETQRADSDKFKSKTSKSKSKDESAKAVSHPNKDKTGYCAVCRQILKDDWETHLATAKHMEIKKLIEERRRENKLEEETENKSEQTKQRTKRKTQAKKSCLYCEQEFDSSLAHQEHMTTHPPGTVAHMNIGKKPYTNYCEICRKLYSEDEQVHKDSIEHMDKIDLVGSLDIDREPTNEPEGVEHILPVDGFICKICSMFYTDSEEAHKVHCARLGHRRRAKFLRIANFSKEELKMVMKKLCKDQGKIYNDAWIEQILSDVSLEESMEGMEPDSQTIVIGDLPENTDRTAVEVFFRSIDVKTTDIRRIGSTEFEVDLVNPAEVIYTLRKLDGRGYANVKISASLGEPAIKDTIKRKSVEKTQVKGIITLLIGNMKKSTTGIRLSDLLYDIGMKNTSIRKRIDEGLDKAYLDDPRSMKRVVTALEDYEFDDFTDSSEVISEKEVVTVLVEILKKGAFRGRLSDFFDEIGVNVTLIRKKITQDFGEVDLDNPEDMDEVLAVLDEYEFDDSFLRARSFKKPGAGLSSKKSSSSSSSRRREKDLVEPYAEVSSKKSSSLSSSSSRRREKDLVEPDAEVSSKKSSSSSSSSRRREKDLVEPDAEVKEAVTILVKNLKKGTTAGRLSDLFDEIRVKATGIRKKISQDFGEVDLAYPGDLDEALAVLDEYEFDDSILKACSIKPLAEVSHKKSSSSSSSRRREKELVEPDAEVSSKKSSSSSSSSRRHEKDLVEPDDENEEPAYVVIGNLKNGTSHERLADLFKEVGVDVTYIKKKESLNYGGAELANPDELEVVLKELDGYEFDGKILSASFGVPDSDDESVISVSDDDGSGGGGDNENHDGMASADDNDNRAMGSDDGGNDMAFDKDGDKNVNSDDTASDHDEKNDDGDANHDVASDDDGNDNDMASDDGDDNENNDMASDVGDDNENDDEALDDVDDNDMAPNDDAGDNENYMASDDGGDNENDVASDDDGIANENNDDEPSVDGDDNEDNYMASDDEGDENENNKVSDDGDGNENNDKASDDVDDNDMAPNDDAGDNENNYMASDDGGDNENDMPSDDDGDGNENNYDEPSVDGDDNEDNYMASDDEGDNENNKVSDDGDDNENNVKASDDDDVDENDIAPNYNADDNENNDIASDDDGDANENDYMPSDDDGDANEKDDEPSVDGDDNENNYMAPYEKIDDNENNKVSDDGDDEKNYKPPVDDGDENYMASADMVNDGDDEKNDKPPVDGDENDMVPADMVDGGGGENHDADDDHVADNSTNDEVQECGSN